LNQTSPAQPTPRSRRRQERGYAILLILFFVTVLLIGTMAVAPNILTQGRRERETEMIWRGKQYVRGIKLYYRKTRKFPTSLDDLTKPQIGNVRFMRQAYKDPMNSKDGEWRLIYVGPNGQLIGSLKPQQTIQLSGLQGMLNAPPGATGAQIGGLNIGQSPGQGQQGNSLLGGAIGGGTGGNVNAGFSTNPTANANTSLGNNTSSTAIVPDPAAAAATSEAANEALLESDPPVVMGGNIIGIGSKINQSSIAVYEKAKNYKQFEFIWDPSVDMITVGGGTTGQQIGAPIGQPGQASPLGTPANPGLNNNGPGSNLNPQPSPPETTPQPPPQQP
jgi:hypothetical protein